MCPFRSVLLRLAAYLTVSVRTERKKKNCFEDPLIENVFWRFFRFVSRKFCLFRLFHYRSKTPKQTETNQKKCFLVSRNKPKNNRNRFSFGLFWFETKKKFDCFEDTLLKLSEFLLLKMLSLSILRLSRHSLVRQLL